MFFENVKTLVLNAPIHFEMTHRIATEFIRKRINERKTIYHRPFFFLSYIVPLLVNLPLPRLYIKCVYCCWILITLLLPPLNPSTLCYGSIYKWLWVVMRGMTFIHFLYRKKYDAVHGAKIELIFYTKKLSEKK